MVIHKIYYLTRSPVVPDLASPCINKIVLAGDPPGLFIEGLFYWSADSWQKAINDSRYIDLVFMRHVGSKWYELKY